MHDLPYYTTVPKHQCMFMAYQKEKKRNPNLAYEEQTSSKTWRQRLISIKKIKTKAYKIKKWKQKGLD